MHPNANWKLSIKFLWSLDFSNSVFFFNFQPKGISRDNLGRSQCEVAFRLFRTLIYFYHTNFSYPVVLLWCSFFLLNFLHQQIVTAQAITIETTDYEQNEIFVQRLWDNSSTGSFLLISLHLSASLALRLIRNEVQIPRRKWWNEKRFERNQQRIRRAVSRLSEYIRRTEKKKRHSNKTWFSWSSTMFHFECIWKISKYLQMDRLSSTSQTVSSIRKK